MTSHVALFAVAVALAVAGGALEGWRWLLWVAGALAVTAGVAALPRRVSSTQRRAGRRTASQPDGVRYRTGERPGPGRYRCELCSWVVQLDDDPGDVSTGPSVVTLEPKVRPGDATLPVCLGCGGMDAPIYERVGDDVPGSATAPGDGRPGGTRHGGAEGRRA